MATNNLEVAEAETTLEPSCKKCWCCQQKDVIPILSRQSLRDMLECCLSEGPAPFEEFEEDMTDGVPDEELRKSCNRLVLKLTGQKHV
jgi:hypothetical protein